ncbi:MAG: HAD hydrolase-like protein [Candidatus Omnitrophota bacterium]|nr:HAD hydrolase-like protein [Candidatus Omnitrophota bacterium]
MIKTIIFDFDGVLVESLDIKTAAFGKLFEDKGKDVRNEVVKYHLDNSGVSRFEKIKYIYREILKEALDEKTFVLLCDRFSSLVVEEVIKAPYVAGALELLEGYRRKYSFYICSGTPLGELEKIIKKRKIDGYFEEVYGSPMRKEDIVRNILKENRLRSDETVYVGDAMSDYKAAESNAVRFIGRNTADKEGLFSDIDCIKIDDLEGLPRMLEQLG